MSVLLIRLPELQTVPTKRPLFCTHCGSNELSFWGSTYKTIFDIQIQVVQVDRYRCAGCNSTFRNYPAGVGRSDISERVRAIAALAHALGYSSREVAELFTSQGIAISHMTICRIAAEYQNGPAASVEVGQTADFQIEAFFPAAVSPARGVKLAVDLGGGRLITIGMIDRRQAADFRHWLESVQAGLALKVEELATSRLLQRQVVAIPA